jgi:ABC-type antimicrobial peptide transport system permease subunit
MFKNYFKLAWRNLFRNKAFSAINICGLALGLACSLLIMLWVQDERSVDGFHANGKQLFQVYERQYYDGKVEASYPTQGLLADELKKVIPEVQYASGFERASAPGSLSTFEAGDKINKMDGMFAGSDFFSMFSYPLLQGTAKSALVSIEGIAISRRMAEQFFGSPDKAMGKMIRYENKEELQVTAVFENIPANSSQQFDFLRSWVAFVKQNEWVHNWGNTSPVTVVQLRKEANPSKVEAKIKDFIYKYRKNDEGSRTELALQPYPEKYLHSTFKDGYISGGRIGYVRLFTLVAIFILLIACINFMNLATARSIKRAKEVGLRKVIGAARSSLIYQFIGEAIMLTFFAVFIAIIIAALLLPAFNELTGKQLILPVSDPLFWAALAGLLIITGLVSGSYPALFMSSLNPVTVLKGNLKFSWGATFFRKGLVVFQFTLSIILIVGMIVIYRQVDFIQTKNIGYDRENLVYIPIEGDLIKNYGLFKEQAGKMPGILTISKMRNSPTIIEHHNGSISWPGKDPTNAVPFADAIVGYDFAKALKLELKEGRDFSKDYGTDSTNFILNETAVNKIGYKDPIGKTVTWGRHDGKIIGVLKDFHFNSMHQAIEPLIIHLDENWGWGTILVRTQAGKTKEAIASLKKICKSVNPKFPFAYQFSDEEYARLYKSEQVVSQLVKLLCCVGYFHFLSWLVWSCNIHSKPAQKGNRCKKSFGRHGNKYHCLVVDRVYKAGVYSHRNATPIAYWAMSKWLESYVYKTNISWWIFLIAGMLAIVIALLTVSFQSIKAAIANPVKSLRTE